MVVVMVVSCIVEAWFSGMVIDFLLHAKKNLEWIKEFPLSSVSGWQVISSSLHHLLG